MARIESSSLPNGLPLHRVELPTRSTTVLVAFDAGARTERPEENGMAHFLEHLVFKGGQKYDDYRKVNQTAETMGAVLNAYTSHDLVAFHITCRAEVVAEAIDLLTDFVGRPKIDAEELDRERGVVIQEIARAHDQPSVAGRAPDRPRGVRRPSARPAGARARGAPADVLARRDPDLPAPPVGRLARRRVPGRQPRPRARGLRDGGAVRALPVDLVQRRLRAGAAVRADDAGRVARVQPVAPADVLPAVDRVPRARRARRAVGLLDAARRLDGLAAVRRDPRAARARLLASTRSTTPSPTCRSCSSPRAWTPRSASRPTRACARSSTSCAPTGRRRKRSSAPARTPPAGACWRSRTPTPSRATPPSQTVVFGQDIDPDKAIAALDAVTYDQVVEVARGISDRALGGLRRPPLVGRVLISAACRARRVWATMRGG